MIGIIVGLFSAKAWAILLGSSGIGYMGLLQSLLGLASMIAGMGIGAGVIRMGANALAREDYEEVAALRRAGWILLPVLMAIEILLLVTFRLPISRWMLGGTEYSNHVILIAIALVFSQVSGFQTSLINTYHRIGALAQMSIWSTFLTTGSGLILVWSFGEKGIAPAVLSIPLIQWILSHIFLHREVQTVQVRPTREATLRAIWSLLRFGGPYTASMMVGMGMQLLLPAVVLYMLDTESVGLYRAALVISMTYLGFLLAAMAQDYYPRVSAASDRPDDLVHIVNQQHRLVMLLAVPMILGVQAVAPYLIRIIYSSEFAPAATILEWQLIGDLFKFSSWTMGFVILARSRSATFFAVELIAGLNIVAMTWLGIHFFGLAGLGIGFLLTYVAHYAVVFIVVRRSIGMVWTRSNKLMMLGATLAMLFIKVMPFVGLNGLRMPVALTLATLAALGSAVVIYRDIGGKEYISSLRPKTFLLRFRGRKGSVIVDGG